jgi:hypothetical protein
MGLPEKRALAAWQEKEFPNWKTKVDTVAGFEIPFEVKWDSLLEDGRAELMNEAYTKVYFQPLLEAVSAVCTDQMGKNALKSALKNVVIDGTAGSSPGSFSFENGVLLLQHKPFSNIDDIKARTKKITELFEKAL